MPARYGQQAFLTSQLRRYRRWMSSGWSYVVGVALIVLGLVFINLDALLHRWHWLAERMPPGTPVPPRRVAFYRIVRVSRGYFALAIGVLFCLAPLLR